MTPICLLGEKEQSEVAWGQTEYETSHVLLPPETASEWLNAQARLLDIGGSVKGRLEPPL